MQVDAQKLLIQTQNMYTKDIMEKNNEIAMLRTINAQLQEQLSNIQARQDKEEG